jgi:hypothetical protein
MGGSIKVVSEAGPQEGQQHRSSNNFSTESLTGKSIQWTCVDGQGNTSIVFTVMHDDHSGIERVDETIFKPVTNGTVTSMCKKSDLYIADPSGAGSDFTVTATGID